MRRAPGLLAAVVVAVLSVRCGGTPSPSSATPAGHTAAAPWWLAATGTLKASGALTSSAVDGFRVHPEPDSDGVVHAFEGENVVVNAADVASRPPAPQTYLIVKWDADGANERVGCGPCRLEHGYSAGRYTLTATADDLQPATALSSSTNRSISLVVVVSPAPSAPFQPFEFTPRDIGVGETSLLRIPLLLPEGVTLTGVFLNCSPFNAATIGFPQFAPPVVEIPFTGNVAGTCAFSVTGTDGAGTPFKQLAKLTIH
jgi:hypothetical protein